MHKIYHLIHEIDELSEQIDAPYNGAAAHYKNGKFDFEGRTYTPLQMVDYLNAHSIEKQAEERKPLKDDRAKKMHALRQLLDEADGCHFSEFDDD